MDIINTLGKFRGYGKKRFEAPALMPTHFGCAACARQEKYYKFEMENWAKHEEVRLISLYSCCLGVPAVSEENYRHAGKRTRKRTSGLRGGWGVALEYCETKKLKAIKLPEIAIAVLPTALLSKQQSKLLLDSPAKCTAKKYPCC